MAIKRSITEKLLLWKMKEKRKPLVVQGVRQCGKTFTLKQFGREEFDNLAYFNFERDKRLADIFAYDFDTSRILRELAQAAGQRPINPADTLVFFDEIQECPSAITALKYFHEDMPDSYIVAAGSLLGPAISHNNISFPVGCVEFLEMYPLSLREFLVAAGIENEVLSVEGYDLERPLSEELSQVLMLALRRYYAIGGMPEAVCAWVDGKDVTTIDAILDDILGGYARDFGKYLPAAEALKVGWLWESIPVQLAKENQKFVFSHVRQGKRAADLENALTWLEKAGLTYAQHLVETPRLPLAFNADATYFKLFMADVGLLRRCCGLGYNAVIEGSTMFANYKGALTENFVMGELVKQGFKPYFWRSGNSAEVDFLIEDAERVVPVEVKSEGNTKAKSYALYCKRYKPQIGIKLSMNNVGYNITDATPTYSLPLYMLFRLRDYLSGSPHRNNSLS